MVALIYHQQMAALETQTQEAVGAVQVAALQLVVLVVPA
jgi:hypothetical protein